SRNTIIKSPPYTVQSTSSFWKSSLVSDPYATAPSTGRSKFGQPVPLSNLCFVLYSSLPQPAHTKVPGIFTLSSSLECGGSVAAFLKTAYSCEERIAFHSFSVLVTL